MRRTLFTASGLFLVCFSCFLINAYVPNWSEEFGKANLYADSLHGRKTSSGEKYDKTELTGAHKSLPFGTKVKVTRLDNKKSVIVKINDRGPFKEGYIIELSRRAAEEIDLDRDGSASVRVEVVPDTDNPTATKTAAAAARSAKKLDPARPAQYSTTGTSKGTSAGAKSSATIKENGKNTELYKVEMERTSKAGYGVQLSTLYDADNVLPIITKLQQQFPGKVLVNIERDNANDLSAYRVIIGPFADEKTATTQQKAAARKGYKQSFIVDLSEI
ncbi:MAG TPA: septal ring lytic transglycosylase RlpA family protein [Saprospiraceae bacterium]|nr:septal ring lytic transglycosylase RlpA family protein [Saprospiraceae bacterium]HPI07412.1 septal ring lytic transglycosylase RlpA family protein [Saprospiraceae bacterium]